MEQEVACVTDYIKRTTTLEALKERGEQLFERTKGTEHIPLIIAFQQAMNTVGTIPTADVVPRELYQRALSDVVTLSVERKRGKWIGSELGNCSCCGHEGCASDIWDDGKIMFCPHCGADLRGET